MLLEIVWFLTQGFTWEQPAGEGDTYQLADQYQPALD